MAPGRPLPALAPAAQLACDSEWLTVEVALRYAHGYPWPSAVWPEIRAHVRCLLVEQQRLRRAGWFN